MLDWIVNSRFCQLNKDEHFRAVAKEVDQRYGRQQAWAIKMNFSMREAKLYHLHNKITKIMNKDWSYAYKPPIQIAIREIIKIIFIMLDFEDTKLHLMESLNDTSNIKCAQIIIRTNWLKAFQSFFKAQFDIAT